MDLDAILEVAIGLVFTWLVLSVATMQVQEWINSWFHLRAQFLEETIQHMLQEKNLVEEFYKHPSIASLSSSGRKPSYIPSERFAQTLDEVYFKKMLFGLEDVKGVGHESASRLIEAGITTVQQLANVDEDALNKIIKPKSMLAADPEKLIEQAKQLLSPGGVFLQAKQLLSPRDLSLEDIKGISPDSVSRLGEAGIVSVEQLAKMKPDTLKKILDPIKYDRAASANEIIEQARKVMWLGNSQLKDIKGLESESVERLHAAGIMTVEQLAKIKADMLRKIIDPKYEPVANEEELIEQAKKAIWRGNFQVKDIKGMGSESVESLGIAGITTVKQLSKIDADTLSKILSPRYERIADEKEIIRHAKELREKGSMTVEQLAKIKAERREEITNPVDKNNSKKKQKSIKGQNAGRDLQDVWGIGPVLAKRLRKKDITTVKELANIDTDLLKEIMGPRYAHLANREKIIQHAKKLISLENIELEDVKGVGPKLAERLRKRGVKTVEELAKINTDTLKEIMGSGYARFANRDKIIGQAKQLVKQKK